MKNFPLCLTLFITFVFTSVVGCGGSGGGSNSADPVLNRIILSPKAAQIPIGFAQYYGVQGVYSDNTWKILDNSEVNWQSSNKEVATVSEYGVASALKPGNSGISVTKDGITSNMANLKVTLETVTLEDVFIQPHLAAIPLGFSQSFTAQGVYSNGMSRPMSGSELTWKSSDNTVAEIRSLGIVKSIAAGSTKITATSNNGVVSNEADLMVTLATLNSISLIPFGYKVPKGFEVPIEATAHYTDGKSYDVTGRVEWLSSNQSVATFKHSGNLSPFPGVLLTKGIGQTDITASQNNVTSETITIEVTDAALSRIQVEPEISSLAVGQTKAYKVQAVFTDGSSYDVSGYKQVFWTISDESIAEISVIGVLKALKQGQVQITASMQGLQSSATVYIQ